MGQITEVLIAAVGSCFVAVLIIAMICVICRGTKRRDPQNRTRTRTVANSDLSSIETSESALFDPSLSRISMPELLQGTRNFSPDLIIGDGGFGLVYKARLYDGVTVAVKKLGADTFQGFREFRAEMETLGKIQHRNIVKILGYYAMGSERVLIYEFVERGSLDQWLHETSSEEVSTSSSSGVRLPLTWKTRLKIIRGVANGLLYMHNLEKPIIHRDIKTSNVLLDSEFEAHIADFGLARRIEGSHNHVSTQVAGTMGYMPPEYIDGATIATVMGDVYSFGILMLEIGIGRRPNLPYKDENGNYIGLVDWARNMVEQGRQMEMVDASIPRDELREEEVVQFFRIATLCARETCRFRPAMKEVVELLDRISA